VGRASVLLGAGRDRVDATIDLAAGIRVLGKPGDRVSSGDAVLELHYNGGRIEQAAELAARAIEIGEAPPPAQDLVLAHVAS
jgi:thymidine phosphorylase